MNKGVKMKVAHIEDDKTANDFMSKILVRYDMDVLQFYNFTEFNKTQPSSLDLILTDGDLGKHSCLDVLELRNRIYPATPIILYSGSDDLINYFKINKLEAYKKPIEMTELLHRIKVYNAQIMEKYDGRKM